MAEHLFDDQQQQQQQNQLQPYGVSFGTRAKARGVPYVPHLPAVRGVPHLRARQLPAQPVREQQHVMLQDQVRQDMLRHNIYQQDKIAYNRRQYPDQQVMSPNRPEEAALVVNLPDGPLMEQRGNDASIEQIVKEILQIKQAMGHMSQVLTDAFAGVRDDAQKQNRDLQGLARQMALLQTRLQ